MALLVQVPWASVRVWPSWAVPEIVGSAVFTGAGIRTAAVEDDTAGVPGPVSLVAVSCTSIVSSTSFAVGT